MSDEADLFTEALFDLADDDVSIGTITPAGGGEAFDLRVRFREAVARREVMGETFVSHTVQAMVPIRELRDARGESTLQVMGSRYTVSSVETDFGVAAFLSLQGPLP